MADGRLPAVRQVHCSNLLLLNYLLILFISAIFCMSLFSHFFNFFKLLLSISDFICAIATLFNCISLSLEARFC